MTKSTMNRRSFLKTSAVGAGALAAPALISSKALASSGEVNFVGWAGYPALAEKVFPAFTAATGITVNFKELPDQDTMFAEAKVALEAGGIDLIEPTIDRWGGWNSNGLLAPFDEAKLAMDNYLPGLADGSAGERSRADGQLFYVPSNWGTESLLINEASAKVSSPHRWVICSTPKTKLFCVRTRRWLLWAVGWTHRANCRSHGSKVTPTWPR